MNHKKHKHNTMENKMDLHFEKAKASLKLDYSFAELKNNVVTGKLRKSRNAKQPFTTLKIVVVLTTFFLAIVFINGMNKGLVTVSDTIPNQQEKVTMDRSVVRDSIRIEERHLDTRQKTIRNEEAAGFDKPENEKKPLISDEKSKQDTLSTAKSISLHSSVLESKEQFQQRTTQKNEQLKFSILPSSSPLEVNKLVARLAQYGIRLHIKKLKYNEGRISKIKLDLIHLDDEHSLLTSWFNEIRIEFDTENNQVKDLRFKVY